MSMLSIMMALRPTLHRTPLLRLRMDGRIFEPVSQWATRIILSAPKDCYSGQRITVMSTFIWAILVTLQVCERKDSSREIKGS
jgi:hypothetical protein